MPPNPLYWLSSSVLLSCAPHGHALCLHATTEDGKEMNLDLETLKIKDIMVEVDRHSRMLGRKEELAG
jgi:hypothetical protein